MQEFTWPGRTAETELALDLEKAALRREFEQRLEECGTLAFRVARGVLHNAADAEDVAQEALLRAYRRFSRLRDPSRFRAWLVRISFRLALDHGRSARRREQRETVWAINIPSRRPRTSLPRTNSSAACRKRWILCRRNHGLSCCLRAWTAIRSKRWQSC